MLVQEDQLPSLRDGSTRLVPWPRGETRPSRRKMDSSCALRAAPRGQGGSRAGKARESLWAGCTQGMPWRGGMLLPQLGGTEGALEGSKTSPLYVSIGYLHTAALNRPHCLWSPPPPLRKVTQQLERKQTAAANSKQQLPTHSQPR